MATPAQIAANRANAQMSTGPRTLEGKASSSLNALKHGADSASVILPGEDPALYERIADSYYSEIAPRSVLEEYQVDTLVRADWQRRRLKRIENNLYRQLLAEGTNPDEIDVTILRDSATGKLLLKIWSQIASIDRAHHRAANEIRRLRRERAAVEADAIEEALAMPELPAMMAAARERHRNEPNPAPKPTLDSRADNPALRL
jgi:hypothetical protein